MSCRKCGSDCKGLFCRDCDRERHQDESLAPEVDDE